MLIILCSCGQSTNKEAELYNKQALKRLDSTHIIIQEEIQKSIQEQLMLESRE